jgi:hypothetical protein
VPVGGINGGDPMQAAEYTPSRTPLLAKEV